jgi:hypothetical protein
MIALYWSELFRTLCYTVNIKTWNVPWPLATFLFRLSYIRYTNLALKQA